MTRLIIALALTLSAMGTAYAACTTHTYLVNGRFVTCTTCCNGTHCNTTCN